MAQNFPGVKNVATLGYREPSLVFLVGTNLDMLDDGAQAAAYLKQNACSLVFVDRRFEEEFQAATRKLRIKPALSTRINGFNINSGRRVDIGAYRMDSGCV